MHESIKGCDFAYAKLIADVTFHISGEVIAIEIRNANITVVETRISAPKYPMRIVRFVVFRGQFGIGERKQLSHRDTTR